MDDFDDYDSDSDDDIGTRPCPECREEVYEEAEQCPACGYWFEAGDRAGAAPLAGKPGWYLALGLLGVVAVIVTLSGLFNWL